MSVEPVVKPPRRRALTGQSQRKPQAPRPANPPGYRPSGRVCSSCDKRKTVHSYRRVSSGVYAERCRVCERDDISPAVTVAKNTRLCACCGVTRGLSRFERHGNVTAEVCDLCTSNPDAHITLQQLDAAAVVLRALRQIRAARLDEAANCPTLGVSAMQALAADALARVEAAR